MRLFVSFLLLLVLCGAVLAARLPLHKPVDGYVVNVIGDSTAFWLVTENDTVWLTPAGLYWEPTTALDSSLLDSIHDGLGRFASETDPVWTSDSGDYAMKTWTRTEIEDSLNEYSLTSAISSTYETITNVGKIGDDTTNFKIAYDSIGTATHFLTKPISKVAPTDNYIFKYDAAKDSFMLESDISGGGGWNWADSAGEPPYWVDSAKHADSANHADAVDTSGTEIRAGLNTRLKLSGGTMTGSIIGVDSLNLDSGLYISDDITITGTVDGVDVGNLNTGVSTDSSKWRVPEAAALTNLTATAPLYKASAGVVACSTATTTIRGVAKFSSDNFGVSTGNVTIKSGGVNSDEIAANTIDTNDIAHAKFGKFARDSVFANTNLDTNHFRIAYDSSQHDYLRSNEEAGDVDTTGTKISAAIEGRVTSAAMTQYGVVFAVSADSILSTAAWTNGYILVGRGVNYPLLTAMSGDGSLNNTGALAITAQSIVGNDIDSTAENFVFDDAYRGTSAVGDSVLITRKEIGDSTTAVRGDFPAALTNQGVKGDHVDSTAENFVFDNAYEGTSAEADSQYSTHNWVRMEIEDSLNEYSLTSAISSTYETITNVGKIGDDTANFHVAYDSIWAWKNLGYPTATTEGAKGIATFNSNNFAMSGGSVYIKTAGVDSVEIGPDQVNDLDINWGSGTDQVDLADIPGGTAGVNAFDYGGATSLEIPNGANPTTDAEGEIAWDSDDDAIEVFDGSVSMLITGLQTKELLIWYPDLITDTVPIFEADTVTHPAGIKIKSVSVLTSVDGTYALKLMSFTAADPPVFHDWIDTLNVGASDQRASSETFEDADASSIDVGQFIYMLTPSTDIEWIKVKYRYYVKDNN